MFKVVSSFIRTNKDHDFFNDLYMNYDAVTQLHAAAELIPGFMGIDEHVYRDDFRCDKALCFKNETAFSLFVEKNQELLFRRKQLIDDYCQRTGQVYKYYMIETTDPEELI